MPDVLQELIAETRLAEAVRSSHDLWQLAVVQPVQGVCEVDPVGDRFDSLIAEAGVVNGDAVGEAHRPLYAASCQQCVVGYGGRRCT
jgi:hypothetical protein